MQFRRPDAATWGVLLPLVVLLILTGGFLSVDWALNKEERAAKLWSLHAVLVGNATCEGPTAAESVALAAALQEQLSAAEAARAAEVQRADTAEGLAAEAEASRAAEAQRADTAEGLAAEAETKAADAATNAAQAEEQRKGSEAALAEAQQQLEKARAELESVEQARQLAQQELEATEQARQHLLKEGTQEGVAPPDCPDPPDGKGGGARGAAAVFAKQYLEEGYEAGLPEWLLQKGIVSYGDTARTRRLLHKLLTGQDIIIAVVGGSITWGHGASVHGVNDWPSVLTNWAQQAFTGKVTLVNRAIPGTPSQYMTLCLYYHVPPEADLVVVEYNINDGGDRGDTPGRRAHERMVRKLLAYPNRPAVMELIIYRWPPPEEFVSFDLPYRYHGDDELGVISQYYHLPWFSSRSLMWDEFSGNSTKSLPNWMADPDHPNDAGHTYMADMAIGYMRRVLEDLALNPFNKHDEEAATGPLPMPMYKDNWPIQHNTCIMSDEFKDLVVEAKGFEWINESTDEKPKFGWVGTQPGSTLTFKLNTLIDAKELAAATSPTGVAIAHLKSYEHMGAAGLHLDTFRLEGHTDQEFSQTYLEVGQVSPAKECAIQITIMDETLSGEHKVKIIGVITSETQGRHDISTGVTLGAGFGPGGEAFFAG